ncbi:MAG TPA: nitroreductase family protein, partial [Candidatus Acidoferrales bacterium]|nr:nitroreductase family protein [Candidatus Acidoferrales bacterium]
NFALHQLRAGDHRGVLVTATGAEDAVQHAPIIIACASTYWRNSWKYQARAYRHCFWDSGTLLANLLAIAAADAVPARVICGFVDDTVNVLLGLDAPREGPLALVALGYDPHVVTAPQPPPAAITFETLPLSAREVDYPAIREMQAASALQTPGEVSEWRSSAPAPEPGDGVGQTFPLALLDEAHLPQETIDSVIQRRGSTRRFAQVPISFAQLSTMLHRATSGIPSDWGISPNELYLIVNAVDGLSAGTYVYQRDRNALELLRAGNVRRDAGHLGLGQELPADASVNIYLLCNLDPVLARFGNRGYRVAQLDAAIIGGKLYLAAYALRLGATGLTFFDDDVTDFFAPHAAGKSVMFLVAVGKSKTSVA